MPSWRASPSAGHARPERAARGAGRRARRARAGLQEPDRLPQGDGVQDADAARRRKVGIDAAAIEADCQPSSAAATPAAPVADAKRRSAGKASCLCSRLQPPTNAGEAAPPPATDADFAGGTPDRGLARQPRSIRRNTKPSQRLTRLKAWIARAPRDRHRWRSRPKPPASIRCRRALCGIALAVGAERSRYRAARPSRGERRRGHRPVRRPSSATGQISGAATRSRRSSRCWKTKASSRSATT